MPGSAPARGRGLAGTGRGPEHDTPPPRVFLTGGSSLVPAVRHLFEERFGHPRIATGGEFTSVARGLALAARKQ